MSTQYAGESIAKKIVRVNLYSRAADLLRLANIDPMEARVLVLAGPEAHETGVLQHIFRTTAKNVTFCDREDRGLIVAQRKWPGVLIHHGSVDAALRQAAQPFHFIHLDFNGHMNGGVKSAFAELRKGTMIGSVVAVTFLRGRETVNTPGWAGVDMFTGETFVRGLPRRLIQNASKFPALAAILALDPKRVRMYSWALRSALLGTPDFSGDRPYGREEITPLVAGYVYDSGNSPMGTVVVQRWRRENNTGQWGFSIGQPANMKRNAAQALRTAVSEAAGAVREKSRDDLLELVDKLLLVMNYDEACAVLAISRRTLAAWRAHRTMIRNGVIVRHKPHSEVTQIG